jgi:hypothetical protein
MRGTRSSNPPPSTKEPANFQSLTTKVFVLVLWISRSIPDSEAFRQQHPNGTRSPLRIWVKNWHRPLCRYMTLLLGAGLTLTHFDEPAPNSGDPDSADR